MYSKLWQVGLDIQTSCVRALAVMRRRYGWQLRYWWQQALPPGVLQDGNLQQPEVLSEILCLLRQHLPKRISLRIALPAQRILQQTMLLPDKRLKEPSRSEFIQLNAIKQLPLNGQTLALDYRIDTGNSTELLITAAHQQEIQCWSHCLQQANLPPEVIDITPCALRYMVIAAGLSTEYILLHRLENEWLWVSPLSTPFRYGLIPLTQNILKQLHHIYPSERDKPLMAYYSSIVDELPPINATGWSPFSIFKRLQSPLPAIPMAFALAGGLAIRKVDY
ncbi:pilus assembly protein PilM [Candidatus Fukatsuia symbiotica]|uniref:Pilus assembly protein HofM n=1 Tax=Candidatus Fukatsuia symbiotica TaxID=1878942 RepID=A0A2U8IA12_9GAMM|nr:pilus assembly protein PilM [Candidatus Fukatsuia symbiotica]AWK14894.1 pilus assembly protein HofM [Candidatus Fukatsuia symbiotica]MEA9445241.1 pilus assembly protein PilM [Candidatus Fukatsuia symbiotica]